MLKCLELIGFKSFADKTRFDFDAGLTAIVGPNGIGKSNVVDSIRWILGEQSPKSLRGSEMADVIFNGAATRRSLGMAEVSLTLDNSDGYLPLETDEVIVTRRVYRSGEGEYLINGQMARLRDIKELFLGTGASTYSIIEQGKVELLLQSSTKDRRHVFEEAAGISRFKAKKIESLRRLDRVEQNLLRIQDIHDEVDKQFRSLRAQAGKAKKYKEYDDELKQVRIRLGLADYHAHRKELDEIDGRLSSIKERAEKTEEVLTETEARHQTVDETLTETEESVRKVTQQFAELAKSISTLQTELASHSERERELDEEARTGRLQWADSGRRVNALQQQLTKAQQQLITDQENNQLQSKKLRERQRRLKEATEELKGLTEALQAEQQLAKNRFQDLAKIENEQAALESQLQFHWQQSERLEERKQQLATSASRVAQQFQLAHVQWLGVRRQASKFRYQATTLHQKREELLRAKREAEASVAQTRDRRTAVTSRIDVLDNLRQRHDGIAGGAREALVRQSQGDPLWQPIVGVLAECLQTEAEYADLIELALGVQAEALVVTTSEVLTDELIAATRSLPGRVQFAVLSNGDPERVVVEADDSRYPALSSLIECEDRFRPLLDRLLGSTFIVETYEEAARLARRAKKIRLVTRDGEVLGPDGAVVGGPKRSPSGILSRGAELRTLQNELSQLDETLASQEDNQKSIVAQLQQLEGKLSSHELRESTLADQLRHFDDMIDKLRNKAENLARDHDAVLKEIQSNTGEIAEVRSMNQDIERRLEQIHAQIKQITQRTQELEQSIQQRQTAREELEQQVQSGTVEAAKAEERLVSLQSQASSLEADLKQRISETTTCLDRVTSACHRRQELQLRLLNTRAGLASLYSEKDVLAEKTGYDPALMERMRKERKELATQVSELRKQLEADRGTLHKDELRTTELRMHTEGVLERILEDYKIDLREKLDQEIEPLTDEEREEARKTVKDLKEKMGRLGSVNVQAVEQLQELEERAGSLKYQIDDLQSAKKYLENVIGKINEESRRLFLDTFETIRQHFQEIFRKLFGGGKADLILEDDTDVLETGIEVIARPPGKEPRSISLLSGGEKSLTAIALLMAIFRSRPSPFCILDEVDAALDESNIGRYVGVLREFMDHSQFILISHSKVTMASADMLHGVTQRESGVSIRVSVRLDDVTEDGRILDRDDEEADQTLEDAA